MIEKKTKRVPQRKCMGCGQRRPKKELVRVVRPPSGGDVTLDTTGKAAGRGVYLCANVACLAKARKAKRLERSLDTAIPDAVYEALESLMPSSRGEEESHGDRTS